MWRGAASYHISQLCSARMNLNPAWGWICCLFPITYESLQRQSNLYVQGKPDLLLSWDVSQGVYQLYETVLLCLTSLNHLSKIIQPRDT